MFMGGLNTNTLIGILSRPGFHPLFWMDDRLDGQKHETTKERTG